MDDTAYASAVTAIYDAALDARRWPGALEKVSDLMGAGPAMLLFQDQTTWGGNAVTSRLDPALLPDFFGHYVLVNPLTRLNYMARLDLGLPITLDQQVIDKSELVHTEFYEDFLKPIGAHDLLMITAGAAGRKVATINIARSDRQAAFSEDDIRIGRLLQEHLARAFQIGMALRQAGQVDGLLTDMMERSAQALILVGSDGVVRANDKASRLVNGDGLVLAQGRLDATSPDASRALQGTIDAALGRESAVRHGGALNVPRTPPRRALAVVIAPVGAETMSPFDLGPAALISITDPEAAEPPGAALLAQLFGLSATEVRVAERLLVGDSPEQLALALGIKLSTARWHLASLFRKTGTGRQADLVRLLLSLPAA